ncbi:MAG: hypothetical protein ACJAYE_000547 [Candidatus Azotimanducaceae bacterium]|jgi:hypothetical protein
MFSIIAGKRSTARFTLSMLSLQLVRAVLLAHQNLVDLREKNDFYMTKNQRLAP